MKKLLSVLLSATLLVSGMALFAACTPNEPGDPIVVPSDPVVADVYAPDGAPALSLAQLMSEDMQFGEGNTVTYNVVAASSIQTYVTGEEPQAELCVLPVNAAAKLLGKGDVYQMLGTVTHGNIYVLSAASKGYVDLTSANLKEQLLGKTVGCIQLGNVVGLTLKVVLDNSDIPFEVIEDVSEATADDVVYLLNISDPATMITPAAPYDYMVAAEPVVSAKVGGSNGQLKNVGDLQALYGGENGWPQAVLVAKKDFIAENAEFVEDFIAAMQANEGWLAAEDTQPQAIVDAITDHLGGANPTFNAKNLTKEVIANCAIRFEAAADCKEEVNAFLQSLTAVGAQGLSVSDDFYYQPGSDDPGSAAAEVVADIYAPDGAPALSLAQLMSEDMQFGEGNTVTYNVVAASSIQTYVTGEDPQAELCVLPVNAAAKLLGKGDVYQMLGTVTHGNIYVLSAAEGYADLTAANLKEQLLGKTVGCIQLDNVVGLTLKVVLDNNDIPFEVIEDVSEATGSDVVYLLNISDPATMITPAAPYDYMVAAEPVVSAKVNASAKAA